jgi:hypothetical protein
MRARGSLMLALLAITLGVLWPHSASGAGSCARLPSAGAALPAAITITTSCGRVRVGNDGRVSLVSADPSPVPRGAALWPNTGVWDRIDHGHLVVGRWRARLWRSHARFPHFWALGAIAVGPHTLAFSYGNRRMDLYVARLGGRERLVSRGEYPLGWTLGGFFTRRDAGGRLLLRSDMGVLREALAPHAYPYVYNAAAGSLLYLAHGTLVLARGGRQARLTTLAALGISPRHVVDLQPMGRLVALRDAHRLVVVRLDGSIYAETRLPRRRTRVDGISSPITTASDASDVAFTATRGNTAYGSHGSETVYLLRPGAREATALHTESLNFAVCERGADLAWRGRTLLYAASEGRLLVLDTAGVRKPIRLSRLVRALAGPSGDEGNLDFSAAWAP